MTVFIKVTKKFGITARDHSIRLFEPGVYEVEDELAKNPFVLENAKRVAAPDDRLRQPVVEPPLARTRSMIGQPLPPAPNRDLAFQGGTENIPERNADGDGAVYNTDESEPDNSAINAANEVGSL